jgi:hypothetical protein
MSEAATIEAPVVATETEAPRSSEDPKIVSAVQAHLDAFDSLLEDGDTPPVEAKPAAVSPADETPATSESDDSTTGETTEETPEAAPEAAPASPAAGDTTLPAAYHRTAKARGWTDEEIANFHKADPGLAIKTFERMHESRTKEINEWAELGRKSRTPAPGASASPAPSPAAPAAPSTGALKPINVAEMVEKYGNQELIEALAGPLNQAIEALTPIIAETQRSRDTAKQTAQESLNKTVQDFFTGKDMASYKAVYGTTPASLTAEQVDMRSKVLETADALIAGAAFQGRQLDVNEALVLAHDSVASGVKETVIRDAIRKDVTKRGKGITLKPTAQGRRATGGAPRDRQELLTRTEDRLAGAFA